MGEPTRELLWGVEEFQVTLHYIAFIVAGVIFLIGIYRVYRIIRQGRRDESRLDNLPKRIRWVIKDSLFLLRLFARETKMGLMHFLLLWGIIVLTIGTGILTLADHTTSEFFKGMFYLIHEFLMDIAGIAFIAGLIIAAVNRYVFKPRRFQRKWPFAKDNSAILLGLLVVGLLGFSVEALRLAAGYPAYTAIFGGFLPNCYHLTSATTVQLGLHTPS